MRYKTNIKYAFISAFITFTLILIPYLIRLIKGCPLFSFPQTFFFFLNSQSKIPSPGFSYYLISFLLFFIELFFVFAFFLKDKKFKKIYLLFMVFSALGFTSIIYSFQILDFILIAFFPISILFLSIFDNKISYFSIPLLLLSFLFCMESFIASFLVFSISYLSKRKYRQFFSGIFLIFLIIISFNFRPDYLHKQIPLKLGLSEFQSKLGIPLFLLIVCFSPFIIHKQKNTYMFFLLIPSLFLSYFFPSLVLVSSFLLLITALESILTIYRRKWQLESLKESTLTLIILISLFSYLSFSSQIITASPTQKEMIVLTATKNLAETLNINKGILTLPEYNYMVHYYTHIEPITYNRSKAITLLKFSNYDKIEESFFKKGVKIIYLNKNMRKQLWTADDRGVIYAYKYMDVFYTIANNEDAISLLFLG